MQLLTVVIAQRPVRTQGILGGCYRPTVARVLLCSCYGVLGGCYAATNTFWVATIQLLGCCYVVATWFWVVVMQLLIHSGWLPYSC